MNNTRRLDFLILLIISMIILPASAAVYYAMLSSSSATTKAAPVYFAMGNDSAGAGLTLGVSGTSATLTLDAYPNVTLYYDQAVNVTATANKQMRLRPVSISPSTDPSVGNFTSIVFRLIRADSTEAGQLSYTTIGNTWNTPSTTGLVSIASGQTWTVKIEITASANALSGISTQIVIAVDIS